MPTLSERRHHLKQARDTQLITSGDYERIHRALLDGHGIDIEALITELDALQRDRDSGELSPADFERAKQTVLAEALGEAMPSGGLRTGWQQIPTRPVAPPQLSAGQDIITANHRFRLESLLGEGGMAFVWKARDLTEEQLEGGTRYKALKFPKPERLAEEPGLADHFKREAVRLQGLGHHHIVRCYGWDMDQSPENWLFLTSSPP